MPGRAGQRPPAAYVALAVALVGVFNAALDQTVVVTALPEVMLDFRLSVSDLDRVAWTVTGYLLGYTAAMPLLGRLSDAWGRRRVYLWSLAVFCLGTGMVASAGTLPWLIAGRVVMAVGGGAMVPVTIALTGDLLPERERTAALGLVGASAEAGAVLGPLWAGVVMRALDWRWIFWLNIPASAVVALLLLLFLHREVAPAIRLRGGVNYAGGGLLVAGLTALTVALSQWRDVAPLPVVGLVAGGVALLAGYAWSERRAAGPLVPLGVFGIPSFAGAFGAHFLVGAALIIVLVTVPLLTNTVMGQGAFQGAMRLMQFTVAIPVGAVAGGFLAARVGYRAPTWTGLGLAALAFFLMGRWTVEVAGLTMMGHLALAGLGFGLVIAPIAASALNAVTEGDRGAAAGLVTAARMLGMLAGLAAITSYGTARFTLLVAGADVSFLDPAYAERVAGIGMRVFREFFAAGMLLCVLALLPSAFMQGRTRR